MLKWNHIVKVRTFYLVGRQKQLTLDPLPKGMFQPNFSETCHGYDFVTSLYTNCLSVNPLRGVRAKKFTLVR